ncbi:MAG: MarC family protein, partial [Candidatus Omnitrophica bacterium]|nr:MarC family protein [Candidatus Omnitrophota bacterium]
MLLESTLILFAIVNPIGSVPVFLQITASLDPRERRCAFRTGVLAASFILFLFILIGEGLLTRVFRIHLADLMLAGGLLLLIIAMDHLVFGSLVRGVLGEGSRDGRHIGAVPIACPVLAGPGA